MWGQGGGGGHTGEARPHTTICSARAITDRVNGEGLGSEANWRAGARHTLHTRYPTVAEKGHPILPLRTNFHTSIHQRPSFYTSINQLPSFHNSRLQSWSFRLPNFSTSKVPPFDSRTLLMNVHAQMISRVSRSWGALKVPVTY